MAPETASRRLRQFSAWPVTPAPRTQRSAPSFLCMSTPPPQPWPHARDGTLPRTGSLFARPKSSPGQHSVTPPQAHMCADQETGEEIAPARAHPQRGHVPSAGTSLGAGTHPQRGLRPRLGPELRLGRAGLCCSLVGREGERERERKSADDATGGGGRVQPGPASCGTAKQKQ